MATLSMDEDEQLRLAIEESLRTARADDGRGGPEPSAPAAPFLPQTTTGAATGGREPVSDYERQRQEAIMRQAARWQQLHGQQGPEHSTQEYQQPASGHQASTGALYPPIPDPRDTGPTGNYPSIPRYSSTGVPESVIQQPQQTPGDPYLEELRRKQQQEEEDRRLAMQLQAELDSEEEQMQGVEPTGPTAGYRPHPGGRFGSSDSEDNDWQRVNRTPSMQQAGSAAAAAGPGSTSATAGPTDSTRPSSQAAAAAGSAAGGLLGAGLSALLAMAANAAARSAQQSRESSAHASASTSGPQQQRRTSSSSDGGRQQQTDGNAPRASATAANDGSSEASGGQSILGMAANALWNYMTGRNSSSSSSTATASNSSSGARSQQQQQQQQHGSGDAEMQMLQQLMRQLMGGGAPNHQETRTGSSSTGGARGSGQTGGGFRVVSLPGGGFAATYGSSSSSGSRQRHAGDPNEDPFTAHMPPMEDLITQLLLEGARSARSNRSRRQQGGPLEPGFTHFDPDTGFGRFEPFEQVFGPGGRGGPDQGLEALIGALLGGQGLGRDGQGLRGMRYEDLVNLDNVHVSTPDDVLAQLPRSKFVEGRKPGDSDTCVICQTQYSVGDPLIHLPCLHAFHEECITPWLQGHSKKCPVCKTDVC